MASKRLVGRKYLAKLADKQAPCAFCSRMIDEETTYGKLYSIGDIHCHYFCVLLSCCLIQKGKDNDGLFGFLYQDILAEIERSKKHKCSYCYKDGATLGCCVIQCRKQFHMPCGREKNAISLFYGNYKSFCKDHAPKQKIPDKIMSKAKARQAKANKLKRDKTTKAIKEDDADIQEVDTVCVICYEKVDGFPKVDTFWPPCCARDAWFHRNCIERMALNAGVHYLKCPLCNDKDNFYKAVVEQGYYVPDRDAAWELEQNAYSEIYERPCVCCMDECKCPNGREFDAEVGLWDIKFCLLCGSSGAHRGCSTEYYVCTLCATSAPSTEQLAELQRVTMQTQNQNNRARARPVMPCRMSIRRTKLGSSYHRSSTSTNRNNNAKTLAESRQELNLSTPKKREETTNTQKIDNIFSSPMKLIEKEIHEKYSDLVLDFDKILLEVREKFQKPRPLVVKRRIVNNILQKLISNISINTKTKDEIKEWNSPKKCLNEDNVNEYQQESIATAENIETKDIDKIEEKIPLKTTPTKKILLYYETPKLKKVNIQNDTMEISENDEIINIDLVKIKNEATPNVKVPEKSDKCCVKFSPFDKEVLEKNNVDIDVESFKSQYLNEVRHYKCNFKHDHIENTNANKLQSPIDFAVNVTKTPPKRKLPSHDNVARKKRKTTKMEKKRKKFRDNTELSIRNRNINLKIKWKSDGLNLKILEMRKKNKKLKMAKQKVLKQYILGPHASIAKPENDVPLIKKKTPKLEKSMDNLKQTSISSFFKIKLPES